MSTSNLLRDKEGFLIVHILNFIGTKKDRLQLEAVFLIKELFRNLFLSAYR
jgi:hypothetical protein